MSPCSIFSTSCSRASREASKSATGVASGGALEDMRQVWAPVPAGSITLPVQSQAMPGQPLGKPCGKDPVTGGQQLSLRIGQQRHPVALPWRHALLLQHVLERM